jgi:imidazolonepropionase-like amidohydrolase
MMMYRERPAQEQMQGESIVERTVRATNHARRALLSGYTTYRDLGSEGMEAFDANFRDAINRGIIPGPRLFVATHALTSTGSYDLRTENGGNGVRGPVLSDVCDGAVGVRRAVRRRVADGADVIKYYADYRRKIMRFPPVQAHPYVGGMPFPPSAEQLNPANVMFTQEEMDAIVDEAKLANLPVACHAGTAKGAIMAAKAGVTSIEHGSEGTPELFDALKKHNVIYVPTLAATQAIRPQEVPSVQAKVKLAHDMGVRLAAGGDTGVFNHGNGAAEMELMLGAGVPLEHVLEACTVGGWETCGGAACGYRFGWFAEGNRADIVALDADPREDPKALRKVSFVMKDGKVWKKDGVAVGVVDLVKQECGHATEETRWQMV